MLLTALFSVLFLTVGVMTGFVANEKWNQYLAKEKHEFEDLFQSNPHPELYDSEGNLDKGTYIAINFEPGFDPDEDGWEVTRDEP
jgi:hypothetical protein